MARRRNKKARRRTVLPLRHRLAVGSSLLLLILCFSSLGYGLFLRHVGSGQQAAGFRVEVLNGTGEKGLAAKAARCLRRKGIDVLRVGNADRFDYPNSLVLARKKNPDVGTFAKLIGCRTVVEQLQRDELVDATLILGSDYRRLRLAWEE